MYDPSGTTSISQMSPQEKALFAAYAQLTVGNRVQAEIDGLPVNNSGDQLTFTDFERDMNDHKVIDQKLARNVSSQVQNELTRDQTMTGNPFYGTILNLVQKAYQLGLVDQNNQLVSRSQVLSDYQNSV